jgi:hypothetical protein
VRFGGHWSGEEEALSVGAAVGAEEVLLLAGFDAFGDGAKPKGRAELRKCRDDCVSVRRTPDTLAKTDTAQTD